MIGAAREQANSDLVVPDRSRLASTSIVRAGTRNESLPVSRIDTDVVLKHGGYRWSLRQATYGRPTDKRDVGLSTVWRLPPATFACGHEDHHAGSASRR
jgi:hypothetical protein